jgi:hypothetical protein
VFAIAAVLIWVFFAAVLWANYLRRSPRRVSTTANRRRPEGMLPAVFRRSFSLPLPCPDPTLPS